MPNGEELRSQIKKMMVDQLMLDVSVEEIQHEQPLFGNGGLGLDSVDALQLVVVLEKEFGLKLDDSPESKAIMTSVETMAQAIEKMRSGAAS